MFVSRRMLPLEIIEILGINWLHVFRPDFEPYFDFEYLAKIYQIITKQVFTKIPTKIPNALSCYNRITLLIDHTRYKASSLNIWKRFSVLWRNWSALSEIYHKAWSLVLKPNAWWDNKNGYCFGQPRSRSLADIVMFPYNTQQASTRGSSKMIVE